MMILKNQTRSSTRVWQFLKTHDAGCCEHQGIQHRGYRLILWDEYFIDVGLWGRRDTCGRCDEPKGKPVAPANKKQKQGVPPPFPPNLILKEDGTVEKRH
ncbi:hypothetical protein LCGC14_1256040 [marine sediment metagenome]|uniref:Uncharacterized protein n=1 Tax=marine sediment metagenome TaxID=412755 RepID=A0A0F9L206_9ZZZZ